jgi:hypothetical protein
MSQKYQPIYDLLSSIFNNHQSLDSNEEKFTWGDIINSLEQYIEWLNDVGKEFGLKKDYTNEHLAEQLFSYTEFNKQQCKYHIYALSKYIKELYEELKVTKNNSNFCDSDFVKGKLALLKDLIWDGFELIGLCEEEFLERSATIGFGRRRLFSSNEIFYSSIALIRRHFTYNDITYSSLAVFQIRQAIETKVLNSLGVALIVDEHGEPAKFKLEILIDFIDKSDKILFPVKKSLLLKITKWTNYYIHRGIMNYHWLIMLAHEVLIPLFKSGKGKKIYSIYGAVKIDEAYFKNNLEKDLLEHLGLSNCNFVKLSHPEAIIEHLD